MNEDSYCCNNLFKCDSIQWRIKEDYFELEKDGWSMMNELVCYEGEVDLFYINIENCPFCGKPL